MNVFWFLFLSCSFLATSLMLSAVSAKKYQAQRETCIVDDKLIINKQSIFLTLKYFFVGILALLIALVFCYISYLLWLHSGEIGAYAWVSSSVQHINLLLNEDRSIIGGLFVKAILTFLTSLVFAAIIIIALVAHSLFSTFFVLIGDAFVVGALSSFLQACTSEKTLKNIVFFSVLGLFGAIGVVFSKLWYIGIVLVYFFLCGMRVSKAFPQD